MRKAAEEMVDNAPSIVTATPTDEAISAEELRNVSAAVSSLKGEKAELEELIGEREEYVEVNGFGVTSIPINAHYVHRMLLTWLWRLLMRWWRARVQRDWVNELSPC